MRLFYQTPLKYFLTSPGKGARTLIFLASSTPGIDFKSGEYYVKSKIARAHPLAYDHQLADQLWQKSLELTQ